MAFVWRRAARPLEAAGRCPGPGPYASSDRPVSGPPGRSPSEPAVEADAWGPGSLEDRCGGKGSRSQRSRARALSQ